MKMRHVIGLAVALLLANAAMGEEAPRFMKDTYPQRGVDAAFADMMAVQGEDAALPGKVRELIGLAVAAQVPCDYCVYYHTKAAKKFGASDAEIREAIALAAQTRKWSTVLNASAYDKDAFEKEVDAMFATE
jgi:AhpD family alkylhydroperoxidase